MIEFLTNFAPYGLGVLIFFLGFGFHAFKRDVLGKRDGKLYFQKGNIGMLMVFESTPSEMRKKERLKVEVKTIDDATFEMLANKYERKDGLEEYARNYKKRSQV